MAVLDKIYSAIWLELIINTFGCSRVLDIFNERVFFENEGPFSHVVKRRYWFN